MGSRAVVIVAGASQTAQNRNLEPATSGLEPRQKLEEAAAKWLENFEFLELEWL